MDRMKIELPRNAAEIIKILEENGYEAYIVGGCTRDAILGREPQDWDITTSARPEEVKRLFRRTVDTGIEHGTVTVMLGKEGYEVTTYRIDGEYQDARHPKEVSFTGDLKEDLLRRDFTINAMAYNPRTGLVDEFGGLKDLREKVIRAVGNPTERFTEDALRILRAVRFAAQLSFRIEEDTRQAMKALAPNLAKISAERIREELNKLLLSGNAMELLEAEELGINAVIFPELSRMLATGQKNPHHSYSVGEHTLHSVEAMHRIYWESGREDKKEASMLLWTMLLHDVAKPLVKTADEAGIDHFYGHPQKGSQMAKEILGRLRFDNHTKNTVVRLVDCHDQRPVEKESALRRKMNRIGVELMDYFYMVQKADLEAQSDYQKKEKLAAVEAEEAKYREILEKEQCVSLKDLAVSGKDLLEAGFPPGRGIGEMLNKLLDQVLEDSEWNEKEKLLALAFKLK